MKPPYAIGRCFFGLRDLSAFEKARDELFSAFATPQGIYANDNLIVMERGLGFLEDEKLMAAFNAHATTVVERGILWRTTVLVWAARQALRLEGDFVECGVYKGTSARILVDAVDLSRPFFLYDLFDHDAAMPHHRLNEHGPELYRSVQARFADKSNVVVTQGRVPESLTNAPATIAFLHIDMNNAEAEIAALDHLFDRVVPGGVIVLDDYGWAAYRKQRLAEEAWFRERGYAVLEMPTGQGMVIKTR